MECHLSALSWKLLIISILIFTYLSVGAVVFEALERPNLIENCKKAQNTLETQLPDVFQDVPENSRKNQESTNLIDQSKIHRLFEQVQQYSSQDMHVDVNISTEGLVSYVVNCPPTWKFVESFFFCGTVITTIGYGSTRGGFFFEMTGIAANIQI